MSGGSREAVQLPMKLKKDNSSSELVASLMAGRQGGNFVQKDQAGAANSKTETALSVKQYLVSYGNMSNPTIREFQHSSNQSFAIAGALTR